LLEKQSEIKSQIKAWGIEHLINQFIMVITLILLLERYCKKDDRLSWAYQYFIDNFSTQPWSRTIDFKGKIRKVKR
jgi:hypothetical protein